jgi:iron complex outermembrane receptor protein
MTPYQSRSSTTPRRGAMVVCAVYCMLHLVVASAQRTDENAVTTAEDAFGVTIGRETLGLYTTSSVRGFSPTAAGNARVDGLYFDQVWALNSRLRRTTTIRVGPSAQSYPFPAPTGIVDHSVRIPGAEPSLSLLLSTDEWGGWSVEADAVAPLVADRLSFGVGAGLFEDEYYDGSDASYRNAGASIRWTATPALEIVPFGARSEARDEEVGPIYVPAGSFLPPRIARRRHDGPVWTDYAGTAINYGLVANYAPEGDWRVRFGAFHSLLDDNSSYANLLVNLQPDGSAERLIVADPPSKLASSSGELRATRSTSAGAWLHLLHLTLRARDRRHRYDGSDTLLLGPTHIGERATDPKPALDFGTQTRDQITQTTVGVAYELRWARRGQLGVGVQRSSYEKHIERPTGETRTSDEPWLYNVAGAYDFSELLTAYASYTRGLEESGPAPESAVNRNEALPAIHTRQADAGIRYALTPSIKLLAGVFDVTKRYFTLDAANRYAALGDVTHRGVELSVSGTLVEGLDVVAGAVLMDPEVTGPDVQGGALGSRPVGQAKRAALLNIDWRPAGLASVSVDLGVRHTSQVPATRDNLVELPARTLIDVGGRYRFAIGRVPATLRFSLTNVTDEYGYELRGSGAYRTIPGRQAAAYLTVDW